VAIAPERSGIGIRRLFTDDGSHPYESVEWERRDARITNFRDGSVAFEQTDVEFPRSWSVNATNIVAQKYFRGSPGTPERETSLREVIDRVADTITSWGLKDGYFVDTAEARAFNAELKHLVVQQKAAFNSPVWFNIGVKDVPQQASACFILAVDDQMSSILNWYVEEGTIFKGGSGSGINLSAIRSSKELLNGGGTASGPVSFMRGADASAGTIKSGGKTRRAAKMVILNVDHPDIEDFIWCKAIEEKKARVLREAGFEMDLDGKDSHSTQYQNANNSVRVTDEFMAAVVDDADWHLRAVTTGEVVRTIRARDLWRQINEAAWECADPGLQFDTTINHWHTAANTGRINASNPCFTGDSLVHTDKGLIRFDQLLDRARLGEAFGVYTHDATNVDEPASRLEITSPDAIMVTGFNEIMKLKFSNGMELRCTAGHKIFTTNRGYVPAGELTADDDVKVLDLPAPAVSADLQLPISTDVATYATADRRTIRGVELPEKWSPELGHYLGWLIGDGRVSGDVVSTVYGTVDLRDSRPVITRFLAELGVSSADAHHKAVPWSIEQAPAEIVAAFLRGLFDADGCVYDGAEGRYVGLGSVSRELLVGVQRLLSTFGIVSRICATGGSGAGESSAHELFDLRISSGSTAGFASQIGFDHPAKLAKLDRLIAEHRFHPVNETVRLESRHDDGVELTYNLSEPRNHSYIVNGVVVRNCSEYMHLDNSACNLASLNLLTFLNDDNTFDVAGFRQAVEIIFTAQEILVGNADYPTAAIGENSRRFRQLGIGYANIGALLMALGLPYDSDEGRAMAASITALMTGHAYATSARTASRMGPFAGYTENSDHMLRVLEQHRAAVAAVNEDLVDAELLGAAQQAWDEACELASAYGVRNSQASVLAPTGTIGLMMDCDTTGVEPDLGLVKMKKLVGGGTMSIVNQTVPRALRRLGYSPEQITEIVAYIDVNKSILGAPHLASEHLPVFACSMGDNVIQYMGHVRMMGAVQPFISGAISKTVNMPELATVEDVEELHLQSWRLGIKAVAIYRDNCKVAQPLSTAKKDQEGSPPAPADGVVGSGGIGVDLSATEVAAAIESEVARRIETELVAQVDAEVERRVAAVPATPPTVVREPTREKLTRTRTSKTFSFRVADCHGYVTVGEYADGRPGEMFLKVAKQGSTLAGIMDAFAISVSHGLQYGVPLRAFVEMFTSMRFEPAGMTDDPDIRFATSLVDYIFRRLAVEYLTYEERAELGILTVGERTQPTLPGVDETTVATVTGTDVPSDPPSVPSASEFAAALGSVPPPAPASAAPAPAVPAPAPHPEAPAARPTTSYEPDAPMCMQCGIKMQRSGSCHACTSCGMTSGCS